jgi:dimethylargininase
MLASLMADVFRFTDALVRAPAPSVVHGLRALDRGAPDFSLVQAEHEAYVEALEAAGVRVQRLPALEAFPDSLFVEDPALVFHEGAIALRPGAPTRFGETAAILPTLRARFRSVIELPGPGHADGGDVLVTPDAVMIGLSDRTDAEGARALVAALAQLGKTGLVVSTPPGVLHFKSDCSLLDGQTILSTPRLAASGVFGGYRVILTADGEEAAANALRINDVVLLGEGFPRTAETLAKAGYVTRLLKTTEIAKIDAGLCCMSLRWRT